MWLKTKTLQKENEVLKKKLKITTGKLIISEHKKNNMVERHEHLMDGIYLILQKLKECENKKKIPDIISTARHILGQNVRMNTRMVLKKEEILQMVMEKLNDKFDK